MAQKSLLQMLEDLASRVRSLERKNGEAVAKMEALEREKREAVVRAQALEREVGELASLIALASEKVDEILKVGANDTASQTHAVAMPPESMRIQHLGRRGGGEDGVQFCRTTSSARVEHSPFD